MSKKGRRPRPPRNAGAKTPDGSIANSGLLGTYESYADSEDEFLENKDTISLDGGRESKRRKFQQEDDDVLELSDEEVLEDITSTSEASLSSEDVGDAPQRNPSKNKAFESSGSESDSPDEDDGIGHWGTSKRDFYNHDEIETEGDALEEEREARRLQQKRLEAMSAADFGIDDNEWLENGKAQDGTAHDLVTDDRVITEVLPPVKITETMGAEERMEVLNRGYPEFGPLSAEFLSLQSLHRDLNLAVTGVDPSVQGDATSQTRDTQKSHAPTTTRLKYQALTAYLGALSMYFALLIATRNDEGGTAGSKLPSEFRDHAIMESLVACRKSWERVKDVNFPDPSQSLIEDPKSGQMAKQDNDEITELNGQSNDHVRASNSTGRQLGTRAVQEIPQNESAKRQAELLKTTEQELMDLSAATNRARLAKVREAKKAYINGDSDLGEDDMLDSFEAAEKARKKRTLRFYTSQIVQKASKRDQAGKDAGGDADLPYRERLQERQKRLNALAEKRGKGEQGDGDKANLRVGSDEEDGQPEKTQGDGKQSDEEYYDLIAAASRKRKLAKKSAASPSGLPPEQSLPQGLEESIGPDGKRAIGYTIEKNKGLAPKRKKDVRNPRVKKRKKYAEKQKKLSSVRQVYKGGEGRGGYGGEATGIKTRLVKSVKL